MSDEIINNIELKPIIIGSIISMVLIFLFPMGTFHFFWVILGSTVSGYLTINSTRYALINGMIIGVVSSFLMMPAFIIYVMLGLFGGFIGKLIQVRMNG